MSQWLVDAPIRRKLTLLVAITPTPALLLAGVVLVGYEVMTFRRTRSS
jgi:hypothetical protein